MEEIKELLQSWKLSQPAVDIIIDKGYTSIELLQSLEPTPDNFAMLGLPTMPDQTMYRMKWNKWSEECLEAKQSTNPSKSNPFTQNNTTYNQRDLVREYSSESEVEGHRKLPLSLSDVEQPLQSQPTPTSSAGHCNPLRNLLENSLAGKQILRAGQQRELKRSEQSDLCNIILDHLLKDIGDQKPKLAYPKFCQWARYIHELFPNEPEAIWFSITPAIKKDKNVLSPGAKAPVSASARPHGKLYDRYGKRQAVWRETKGLVKKKKITGKVSPSFDLDQRNESPVQSRRKKGPQLPSEEDLDDFDRILVEEEIKNNDDITTISQYQGLELTSILETAWKVTWPLRKRYLLSVASVAQYLERFPVLRVPDIGPHLIKLDFCCLYQQVSPSSLYNGLRKHADFIELRAALKLRSLSKTSRAQQQKIHDLPKDNELQKVTASLFLLPFAVVGGKTGVRTKASRFDAASNFIFLAKTRSEGESHLEELRQNISNKQSTIGVQPLVIAVGEDISTISCAFTIVDNVWFYCNNVIEAVDLCFKCFYVFNLRYPPECEHIWQVLQFICYGIKDDKVDKYIIDVNKFVNEMDRSSSSQEIESSSSQETVNSPDIFGAPESPSIL